MAEKNIAALLDDKAHTVGVQFTTDADAAIYTYVTDMDLIQGDVVVVPVKLVPTKLGELRRTFGEKAKSAALKLAVVVKVDKVVDIPANDDKEYGWVISHVRFDTYAAKMERNAAIDSAVSQAYQKSLRRSFAERVLGELGDEDRSSLLLLLGK